MSVVSAQSGGIQVSVMDSDGQPLPAATVEISHPTGYVGTTAVLTDAKGIAEFPVLRATGSSAGYNIKVSFPGFASVQLTDQKVSIGQKTRLPIQLQQEITETVKVTAQSDVVDLENTQQTTKFSDEFIQDLPVPGRFYQNVLTLAPGVQDADGDGNPNVHGSRDRDFKAEVSGISNVDPLSGQQMSQVNPNSIEEMEVITAGAGAEFSRAQGGFARILQKQGGNQFEGVFEMYYQSSLLDGTGAQDFDNTTDPDFTSFQPGLQISGPIIKDKLWYRLSHQLIQRDIPTNTTQGIAVVQDDWSINADQITWQASPRNKLAFQYQSDPRTITNFGVSSTTPVESAQIRSFGSDVFQMTWTAPYSPKILIETKVAYQEASLDFGPTGTGTTNDCASSIPGLEFLANTRCFNTQNGQISGPLPIDHDDARERLTVRGDTTVYAGRFWGATHEFKFGVAIENENYLRSRTQRPDLIFSVVTDQDPTRPNDEPIPKIILDGIFSVPDYTQINAKGSSFGIYGQDQFKPTQNLTVTLGFRIDREEIRSKGKEPFDPTPEFETYLANLEAGIPTGLNRPFTAYEDVPGFFQTLATQIQDTEGKLQRNRGALVQGINQSAFTRRNGNININNTNPAPRLSISWDPWSNGKTKVFATAGRYYDKIFLAVPLLELNAPTSNLLFESFTQQNEDGPPTRVVELAEAVAPSVNVNSVDRNLETPYQDEWTLGFEREIATETSMRLTYVNRRFRNQLQDLDLNHAPADYGKCITATNGDTTVTPVVPSDPVYDPAVAPGDGQFDDCIGRVAIDRSQNSDGGGDGGVGDDGRDSRNLINLPDGAADLYTINPFWGNLFLVGNLNQIDYDGVTLELNRRLYRSWQLTASYTWSQAFGDGEDFQQNLGDDRSTIEDEQGFQAYDQTHFVKVTATTVTPWGLRIGGSLSWQSGLPFSVLTRRVAFDAKAPPLGTLAPAETRRTRTTYDTGQRNDQRNEAFWNLDLKLTKEFNIGRKLNMQVSAEVFNAFNDGTYQIWNPITQTGERVNGVDTANNRFGRQWQLGVRFAF
jgi:outer membrane receptor protein involved in Fe transport